MRDQRRSCCSASFSPSVTRLVVRIDIDHVNRIPQRHADALSLADGEMLMAFVRADDCAAGGHQFARAKRLRAPPPHQTAA